LVNRFSNLHVLARCRGASERATLRHGERRERRLPLISTNARRGARWAGGRFAIWRWPTPSCPCGTPIAKLSGLPVSCGWGNASLPTDGGSSQTVGQEGESMVVRPLLRRRSHARALFAWSTLRSRHTDSKVGPPSEARRAELVNNFSILHVWAVRRLGEWATAVIYAWMYMFIYTVPHKLTIADRAAGLDKKKGSWRKVESQAGAGAGDKIFTPNSR
jgi:hypothetical protein